MSNNNSRNYSFSFNPETSRWSLSKKTQTSLGIFNATCSIEVDKNRYYLEDADKKKLGRELKEDDVFEQRTSQVDEYEYSDAGFKWNISFEPHVKKNSLLLHAKIKNVSKHTIVLNKCRLIDTDVSCLNLGPKHEDQTFLFCMDSLATNHVKKLSCGEAVHEAKQVCHIFDPETKTAFMAAYVTYDRINVVNQLHYSRRKGILSYDNFCDFNGFELLPGKEISTEKLLIELNSCPYEPLERWADIINRVYKPPIKKEIPVGWVGWSWIDLYKTESEESLVERNSKAIRKRLKGFDINYLWISIANLKDCLPGNWLEFNNDFFPNGLLKTLSKLKKRKFKPGFWIAPFYIVAEKAVKENWNNLMKGEDGTPRKYWQWAWSTKTKQDKVPWIYTLDPSHPDSISYITKIFTEYRKLGIRYYMVDFLSEPRSGDYPSDKSMINGTEMYRKFLMAVRKAAGQEAHILTATGPTMRNVGISNSTRIGADYGEGRQLLPRFSSYPANFIISGMTQGSAGNPNHNALQNLASLYFTHRKLYQNNSNILTIDKPIPLNEALISTSLFGMSGSPIMLGDDIDTMSKERLVLVKKVLPRTEDTSFPVDLFKRVYPEDYSRVLVAKIKKRWGEWMVVAVFNLDPKATTVSISAEELCFRKNKSYRLYDFWDEKYCGMLNNDFDVEVPACSCKILRIEEVKKHPWVLSTDMHIRQGQVELDDVEWDGGTLKGTAMRPKGESGNLIVISPEGFKPKNFNKGLFVAKSAIDNSLVIRKSLDFISDKLYWEIEFEKMSEAELALSRKGK